MSRNRLARETSPYLLQHADNPVDWRPWGPETLAEAKENDKPILLSVGYAACHWCHVMAHECFEDPDIAEAMNRHFVNIKVDREERPDLDTIYQTALALIGQHGGWPLTMFLTPEGEPFWGGTFFPGQPKYGLPGFKDVLEKVAEIYHQRKDMVDQNRAELLKHLGQIFSQSQAGALSPDLLDQAAQKLAGHIDRTQGGLGGAPKFPQPVVFEFLWRAYLRTGEETIKEAVTLTLDHIAQGGIYDHLGGGFARYSVDEQWLVPHFEKMLYDNALLINLYTLVWQETRKPLYAERVGETMEWLAREMIAEGGGFASSLDADSEGEEGKFYVWSAEEVESILGPEDFKLFADVYGLSPGGNWEGVNILNRLNAIAALDAETEARLARCRDALFRERSDRVRPGWDDKVLTDWNGLMITAVARAAAAFDRPEWLAMAERAFAFITQTMRAEDGRLYHAWRDGHVQKVSLLDDHAHMMNAALALREAAGEEGYRDWAEAWAEAVETHFRDHENGGYVTTADDAEGLILRTRSAQDSAQPSGNGALLEALARLHHITASPLWRERAEALAEAFGGEVERNFFPLTAFLNGYETLVHAIEATVVGARGDDAVKPYLDAYFTTSLPTGVLRTVADPGALPEEHPATTAPQTPGTALVCAQQTCSLPLSDAESFAGELKARRLWRKRPAAE